MKTNKITTLDLSSNPLLETLVLSDNHIESIRLDQNKLLTHLWMSDNMLTSLDVSLLDKLINLSIRGNQNLTCVKVAEGQSIPTINKSDYQKLSWDCNEGDMTLPQVESLGMTEIGAKTAISGGHVVSDGGSDITSRGVCWSVSNSPSIANSKTNDGIGEGYFTSSLIGLSPNTTYYLRAYATNRIVTAYGEEIHFTTGSSVYTGDVYLKSQQEVDEFGSLAYTEITGDLVIEPAIPSHFSNLKALSSLRRIGGALIISKTIGLQDLTDLKEISRVGDYVLLSYNQDLSSIGLEGLASVGNYFNILFNENLIDLAGLNSLRTNGGKPDLTVWSNTKLNDFCGIRTLLSDFTGILSIVSNAYNPSQQDITDGNCRP